MIKFSRFFLFLLILMFSLTACESDSKVGDANGGEKNSISVHRNPDYLPPIEIAIAPAIQDDPELVDMVHSSEKAINEFSDNIERLAVDGKKLVGNKGEEPSLGDGLRIAKIMMSFASNSVKLTETVKKFETYMDDRKDQGTITDEQIEALDEVGKAFSGRMEQLGKKYEKMFNQE